MKGPVRHIIGCCADKASVLWFLSYHRHQNNTIQSNIRNHQLSDALNMPSDSDFDSDEEFTEEWTCGVVTKELTLLIPLHMVLLPYITLCYSFHYVFIISPSPPKGPGELLPSLGVHRRRRPSYVVIFFKDLLL